MTASASAGKKRRLGEILTDAGVIDELQLKAALAEQRKWGGKLGRTLIEMGFLDEESMVLALSRQLALPLVDLDKIEVPAHVVKMLRVEMAERYGVFPIAGDRNQKTLQLATSDPTNIEAVRELAFATGLKIQLSVAMASRIERAIRRHYYGERPAPASSDPSTDVPTSEPSFESQLTTSSGANRADLRGSAALPPAPVAGTDAAETRVIELSAQVAQLEKIVGNQVRAMRSMLELLAEKGVLTREEFVAKLKGKAE